MHLTVRVGMSQPTPTAAPLLEPQQIKAALAALTKTKVTMAGQPYNAIDSETCKILVSSIEHIINSGNDAMAAAEIANLRELVDNLEEQAEQSEAAVVSLKSELKKARGVAQASDAASDSRKVEIANLRKQLTELDKQNKIAITNHQKEHAILKAEYDRAKHGFDPEAAVEIQEKYEQSKIDLQKLMTKATEHAQERTALVSEVQTLAAAARAREKLINDAQAEIDNFRKVQEDALVSAGLADQDPDKLKSLKLNMTKEAHPQLYALLGGKAFDNFAKISAINAEDVKARLHAIVQSARETKHSAINQLKNLLQLALDWSKSLSYRARQKIQPWVDLIVFDIVNNSVKSISTYRDHLQKLTGELKAETKRSKDGKIETLPKDLLPGESSGLPDGEDSEMGVLESVYWTLLVFKNKFVRKTKAVSKSTFGWIHSTYLSVKKVAFGSEKSNGKRPTGITRVPAFLSAFSSRVAVSFYRFKSKIGLGKTTMILCKPGTSEIVNGQTYDIDEMVPLHSSSLDGKPILILHEGHSHELGWFKMYRAPTIDAEAPQ